MGVVGEEKIIVTVKTTVEAAKTVYETPTIPSPASYTSLSDFKETVLQVSNEYRGSHEAEEVVWNETLVKYAQSWAETCIWKHSVCTCAHAERVWSNGFTGWSLW